MRWTMLLGLALLSVVQVFAEQFEFLPPETEGTYSIGIYDKKGALVRTLVKEGSADSFKIGLNGFIAKWDEKLEDGSSAPAGKYKAKGYVIPKLKVSAMEEMPNVAEKTAALFEKVDLIGMEANGPFVIGKKAESETIYWREDWTYPLPILEGTTTSAVWHEGQLLLCIDKQPVIISGGQIVEILESGKEDTGETFLYLDSGIGTFGARGISRLNSDSKWGLAEQLPVPNVKTVVSSGRFLYSIDAEGSIFQQEAAGPAKPFEFEKFGKLGAVCAGSNGSIWLVETNEAGAWELREFAADGDFLRQMPGSEGSKILSIAASADDKQVALLREEKDGALNLVKLTARADEAGEVAEFSEKVIPLVAAPVGDSTEIRLTRNPLEPGVVPRMKVSVAVDEKGVVLTTHDGLFLKRLLETEGIKAASLEILEGNMLLTVTDASGKTVLYGVSGLRKAMAFEPGDLEVK